MDNNQYPATGGLFAQREKRSDKSPDYSGMLSLEMEVVNDIIKQKEELKHNFLIFYLEIHQII